MTKCIVFYMGSISGMMLWFHRKMSVYLLYCSLKYIFLGAFLGSVGSAQTSQSVLEKHFDSVREIL